MTGYSWPSVQVMVRSEKYRDARAALNDVERALERRVRPPSVRARMLLLRGRMALEENDGADAREALRAAVELPGAPIDTWFYPGEALAGHNTPEARTAYEYFLEHQDSGPLVRRAQRALEVSE